MKENINGFVSLDLGLFNLAGQPPMLAFFQSTCNRTLGTLCLGVRPCQVFFLIFATAEDTNQPATQEIRHFQLVPQPAAMME